MDVNGDNRDDLVCVSQPASSLFAVFLSTGSMTTTNAFTLQFWPGANVLNNSFDPQDFANDCVFGDFNGDGLKDIACYASYGAGGGTNWTVALSTGTGFHLETWTNGPNGNAYSPTNACIVGDFDGDGASDIACALFNSSANYNGKWQIGFGGVDGKFKSQQTWNPGLPIGTGYTVPQMCNAQDLYGTGRTGLLCMFSLGNAVNYLSSTGTAFVNNAFTLPFSLALSSAPSNPHLGLRTQFQECIFGDFNGDQIPDMACPLSSGFQMALSSRPN
jgi:hypothetical protein